MFGFGKKTQTTPVAQIGTKPVYAPRTNAQLDSAVQKAYSKLNRHEWELGAVIAVQREICAKIGVDPEAVVDAYNLALEPKLRRNINTGVQLEELAYADR